MIKPIEGVTQFRHWSEFQESPERYISAIEFRPEEDPNWNYPGCPPYMVAQTTHTVEFYLIPPAMAYYAAVHQGWTRQGRRNAELTGEDRARAQFRKCLGLK
jgi:hypothetical protein